MTLEEKIRELNALGRPPMQWATPRALAAWRRDLDQWRAANPGGEEKYCQLLAEIEAIEKRQPPRLRAGWAENAGLGERVVEALADTRPTQAVEAVRQWQTSGKTWCVLLGSTGTGKSVAGAVAIRDSVLAGRGGAFVHASDFARVAGGFDGMADKLAAVGVLVIDDFGTEHLSEFARSVMFGVMAARHDAKRPTVITSNLNRTEFAARLGERLADRIRHDCVAVDIRGLSLRDPKREGGAA